MKTNPEKLKAEFLAEAEALFDQLMTWDEQTSEPDLTQIEEIVLQLRQRLREQMAKAVIARQEKRQPASPGRAGTGAIGADLQRGHTSIRNRSTVAFTRFTRRIPFLFLARAKITGLCWIFRSLILFWAVSVTPVARLQFKSGQTTPQHLP
jgi:hypothetical protein